MSRECVLEVLEVDILWPHWVARIGVCAIHAGVRVECVDVLDGE